MPARTPQMQRRMAAGRRPGEGGTLVSKAEHGTSLLTAFTAIRKLIVHGRMSPGSWIVEGDLAEHLGMSRTPVRGALHWLQREGYVLEQKNASKSRMFVAPLTLEDASELYAIIGGMEGLAGRNAAILPRLRREAIAGELRNLNRQLGAIICDSRPSGAASSWMPGLGIACRRCTLLSNRRQSATGGSTRARSSTSCISQWKSTMRSLRRLWTATRTVWKKGCA
jgi:biotin operon repressor